MGRETMNYLNNISRRNTWFVISSFFRLIIISFVFLYTYVFLSPLLILRLGLHATNAAIISLGLSVALTGCSYILSVLVLKFVRLPKRFYVMAFMPSLIFLSLVSAYASGTFLLFCIVTAFVIVLSFSYLSFSRKMGPTTRTTSLSIFQSNCWITIFLLTYAGWASRSNDVAHYEARMQCLYMQGKYNKALKVGQESLVSSIELSQLRALALAKMGKLPTKLFDYPQYYGALSLCPLDSSQKKSGSIRILCRPTETPSYDYYLCSLLLDKKLDSFAEELPKFYDVKSKLPKYYAQALILYKQVRTHPIIIYNDNVCDANLQDFIDLQRKNNSYQRQSTQTRRDYGDTYWWYYFYQPIIGCDNL